MIRKAAVAVDEPRVHADRARTVDVVRRVVADHRRRLRSDAQLVEHRAEDRLVRLRLAVDARGQDRVDLDAVVRDELVEIAAGVRQQRELEAVVAQLVEHRQRVVEQLEVLGTLPRARHLDGARVRVAGAAHPLDDPLGEEDPDLLVVVELGMPLQRRDRLAARGVVAGRDRGRGRNDGRACGSPPGRDRDPAWRA